MPLRLGIIGAGHLGRFHAKVAATHNDIQLVAVADPVREAAERVAAEAGCAAVTDYKTLLPEIDAAIVATPTCLHFGIGRELLKRGIHCLIEKPITPSVAEADELVALARRQGLVLQVGHIERFSPGFTAIRDAAVGARLIQSTRCGAYSFRSTDIGVVFDLMVHDLDLCMRVANSGVQSVEAMGLTVFGPHEDLAHARLTFDNGCVAVLHASRVSEVAERKMEVWTDTSRIRVNFADRSATVGRTNPEIVRGQRTVQGLPAAEVLRLKEVVFEELIHLQRTESPANNPLAEEQRDFLEAIREGRDPQVTGEHGRDVVAVAERILARIAAQQPSAIDTASEPQILRGPHWTPAIAKPEQERRKSA